MVLTYVLSFVIPGGQYPRVEDANGNLLIDTSSAFTPVEGGIPFWKWILSPILVLTADGNTTLIAVVIFLLVIGGVFNALDKCGLVRYMLSDLSARFGKTRYRLLTVVTFFFMAMGSLVGSFEECVPLVPIVVALAVALGWDALTGVGMSLLAVGCGFAAGVFNPFTVGVAQSLAGLPMFSGVWLRALSFVCIYCLLLLFLRTHAKKVERPLAQVFSISPQLCVVAFAFGDGFSNVFYPTNPALLISLGLVDVDYGKWFRWSWKFQTMNLVLTSLLLLLGLAVGY